MTTSTDIVVVNVFEQNAGIPNPLQQRGAFVTQGGTTLAAGSTAVINSLSALLAILAPSVAISTLTWASTVAITSGTYNATTGAVTLVLPAPANFTVGGSITVSGATGTGSFASINGTHTLIAGTSGTTAVFTIATSLTLTITGGSVAVPGFATLTAASALGWTTGDTIPVTIAGVTPTGYNGTFNGTVTGSTTLTYPLASNPGATTVLGTVALGAVGTLKAMGTTYFAQPTQQAVYVLELGEGTVPDGTAALATWITNNPKTVYAWLVPPNWDGDATFLTMLANYTSPLALTYFWITAALGNVGLYTGLKCALVQVPAPGEPSTQFGLAALFAIPLNYSPSSANLVPSLCYSFLYGVTAWPTTGASNLAAFLAINAANGNWIGTGAEGGLSDTISFYGQMADGNPFNYWYAADAAQLRLNTNLSAAIINGSNTNTNPLYYNQQGINRLQNVGAQTLNALVSEGLLFGIIKLTQLDQATYTANYNAGLYNGYLVLNAVPFSVWNAQNPNAYALGTYGGFSAIVTPNRGFKQVTFDLTITNIVAV